MRQNLFQQFHKIALFGGTFNPVHIGHIQIAKTILNRYPELEQLIFMPNHIPAYKNQKDVADGDMRLAMLLLAAKDLPKTMVSDMEIKRKGYTYTVDTLAQIRKKNPNLEISFLIGDDSLFHLHMWHEFEQLAGLCKILVVARGENRLAIETYIRQFCDRYPGFSINYVEMEKVNVSSSIIRNRIANGESIEGLVPENVWQYIKEHDLYM